MRLGRDGVWWEKGNAENEVGEDGVWWEKGNRENEVGEGWSLVGEREHAERMRLEMESGRRKRTQKMRFGIERWSLVGEREHRE